MRFAWVLLLLLLSCSKSEQVANNQMLVVGTCSDNQPFEFIQNGQIVGFDIDLIQEVAKQMGKSLKIKNMAFPALIPALHSGDVDLLIAGLSKTDKRQGSMDFSICYASSSMSIISNLKISNLNDLQDKIIGAQMGSTWHHQANQIAQNVDGVQLKLLSNNLLLMQELTLKKIDAVIIETSQVKKFQKINPGLNVFEIADAKSNFSIAMNHNSQLKDPVDQALIALRKSGAIAFLTKKWFN